MKMPELRVPQLEFPESRKGVRIATIAGAVILLLLLIVTIVFRVVSAGSSGGVKAVRAAGVLRAAVPVEEGACWPGTINSNALATILSSTL